MSGERMTGKVKWFNEQKGFGFITPDDNGPDLFVHFLSIISDGFRTLREGEWVEFRIEQSADGRSSAVEVTGPNGKPVVGSRSGGSVGGADRSGSGGYGGGRGGRSGGDYGSSGGGGGACFSCGEMGHVARDCHQGGGRYGGGGGNCYNCGGSGHFARDCPNAGR